MQKTTMLKKETAANNRVWYTIDASGVVLGKLAVEAANIIRGKNKPNFTPNVDCGDNLIIINSDKVVVTGNKATKEFRYNHSGYIGGIRKRSVKEMIAKYSDELVTIAVKGMLPKNRLSEKIIKKLHVYKDAGKDHSKQKPKLIKVGK
ncbi:MAG: 50S ribosomal protein L13 [Mycoplasma sp.]|nr:50S ribosomal protein L13 [Candidatus Hennigella equi]